MKTSKKYSQLTNLVLCFCLIASTIEVLPLVKQTYLSPKTSLQEDEFKPFVLNSKKSISDGERTIKALNEKDELIKIIEETFDHLFWITGEPEKYWTPLEKSFFSLLNSKSILYVNKLPKPNKKYFYIDKTNRIHLLRQNDQRKEIQALMQALGQVFGFSNDVMKWAESVSQTIFSNKLKIKTKKERGKRKELVINYTPTFKEALKTIYQKLKEEFGGQLIAITIHKDSSFSHGLCMENSDLDNFSLFFKKYDPEIITRSLELIRNILGEATVNIEDPPNFFFLDLAENILKNPSKNITTGQVDKSFLEEKETGLLVKFYGAAVLSNSIVFGKNLNSTEPILIIKKEKSKVIEESITRLENEYFMGDSSKRISRIILFNLIPKLSLKEKKLVIKLRRKEKETSQILEALFKENPKLFSVKNEILDKHYFEHQKKIVATFLKSLDKREIKQCEKLFNIPVEKITKMHWYIIMKALKSRDLYTLFLKLQDSIDSVGPFRTDIFIENTPKIQLTGLTEIAI